MMQNSLQKLLPDFFSIKITMNGKKEKMNTELQKKWFVYLMDHHEGPFDANELSLKKKNGLINQQSYVWAEGMADWKPLIEVSELSNEIKKFENTSVQPKKKTFKNPFADTLGKLRSKKMFKPGIILGCTVLIPVLAISVFSRVANEELHAGIRPTLNKIVAKAPVLSVLFNLIPHAGELSSESRKEMEEAIIGDPTVGVKFTVTLLQSDPTRPSAYLATNLPDRTKFNVYLIGNSETLVNRLSYQGQFVIQTFKGIGKSEVLLLEDGQPLSKGEYDLWITESSEQEESLKEVIAALPANRPSGVLPQPLPNSAKFVLKKTLFIGGARDENYLTRLKAFHEKIKQNSEKEMVELRQYSDTLALQFQTLTSEFAKVLKSKKPTASQKDNWKQVSKKWLEINGQLEQTIQTWSKETLQNEFFYGNAYELVKGSYDSIKNLFKIENEYMDKPTEKSAFEIQYGKAANECRLSLNQLKGKIEMILKAPKSPNGLPKRDVI